MKKIALALFLTMAGISAFAQKTIPAIKAGTEVSMDLDYHGQALQFALTVRSVGDLINMDWDVSGTGGTFAMKAKGLQSGVKFGGDQPTPGSVTTLGDDETFMSISKAAYQALLKNKTFVYGPLTFVAKDMPGGFKIGAQAIDATYAATADGKTSLWILNNPDFPLTLDFKGNPAGINYTATSIK